MSENPSIVTISYDESSLLGRLDVDAKNQNAPAWIKIRLSSLDISPDTELYDTYIQLPWANALTLVRQYGAKTTQQNLNFRFRMSGDAELKIKTFLKEYKKARADRSDIQARLSLEEIDQILLSKGFTERTLKPFQMRDLQALLALSNGANFSVPGAGKTTVTFALNTIIRKPNDQLLIIAPKAAFQAWSDIVLDCMGNSASAAYRETFTILSGSEADNASSLFSSARRFVMSYDLMIRQQPTVLEFLARHPTHLVLDESHRMKAGWASQRGAFLLGAAALPIRRDILSGTPMPQGPSDMASQLSFLWPGHGYENEILAGSPPRKVLGSLYVRTTKKELGLRKPIREIHDIKMAPGQLALYSIVRDEALRQLSKAVSRSDDHSVFLRAKKSVMRLLQLSSNPLLALNSMANDDVTIDTGIVDTVVNEGPSEKLKAVMGHARRLARSGQKVVIWTIFTQTIKELETSLADLNPVTVYGGVPSGEKSDLNSREGRIQQFHMDDNCSVLIANPAAAGEGISLHTVCHNAIYVDRSYVSTHYIQSIDRIHRLGLPEDVETYIHIYRTKAPPHLGSIDMSVSRRLMEKIRNMQELLDDPDLLDLVLDEEAADDPLDYDVRLEDLIDLVRELEGKGPTSDLVDV